jgi:hypothetical protein
MKALLVAVAALATIGVASAQSSTTVQATKSRPGTWVFIGETEATHTDDHDVVHVKGPGNHYRQLKLHVGGAGLHLEKLVVTYDDGSTHQIPTIYLIKKGESSPPIDLPGAGKHALIQVNFTYNTKGWLHGSAHVSLYGLH